MQPLLAEAWWSWDIPGVRESRGTYRPTPLHQLPSINVPDDLSWLRRFDDAVIHVLDAKRLPGAARLAPLFQKYEGMPRNGEDAFSTKLQASLDLIIEQSHQSKIRLPTSFVELFLSPKYQWRLYNPTACEFDLHDKGLTQAPFREGGWIVRFLNDQQWCLCWYLHISPNGDTSVLSSYETRFALTLEEHDPTNEEHVAAVLENTNLVAHSFPEFLYRFWIEAALWFKCAYNLPTTVDEERYLRDLKRLIQI